MDGQKKEPILNQTEKIDAGKTKAIDSSINDEDYDKMRDYESSGCSACEIASVKGVKEAQKYLDSKFQGIKYDFEYFEERDDDDPDWPNYGFKMRIYGSDGKYYQTQGNADYTDDQYFYDPNKD